MADLPDDLIDDEDRGALEAMEALAADRAHPSVVHQVLLDAGVPGLLRRTRPSPTISAGQEPTAESGRVDSSALPPPTDQSPPATLVERIEEVLVSIDQAIPHERVPLVELRAIADSDGSGFPPEAIVASQRYLAERLLRAYAIIDLPTRTRAVPIAAAVEEMLGSGHTLVVNEDGEWVLEHSLACRMSKEGLAGCPISGMISDGPVPPGRYKAWLGDDGKVSLHASGPDPR